MKVQILMATCNTNKIKELNLKEKNINDCVIINQFAKEDKVEKQTKSIMYHYNEKGVSKSRNRAISHATGDIAIITDDDVSFLSGYDKLLEKAYKENPDADVITFNSKIGDRKIGFNKYRKHNNYTIMMVSSIQISFKLKSINKNKIKFDENFGLGAKYKAGEENIFLHDCLKKGLKIIHVPVLLNTHPDEATTGEKWDEELVKTKGAFSYRILKHMNFIFLIYFAIFKHNNYKDNMSVINFIKYYRKGLKEYKKMK